MTDSTGTTSFTYDNANRQTAQTAPNGTTSYQYDAADRRTQMSVGTSAWTYVYDNVNRLTSETNPSNETTGYTYDNGNRLTGKIYANGSTITYAYDTANRAVDVWHKTSGGATITRSQYDYDPADNVIERDDNDGSVTTFAYDNSDQLASEVRTGTISYSVGYTYDHNGNRLTKTLNGVTDTYVYDAHDKLLHTSNKSYTYDNNGNCRSVTVTATNQTTTLTYDYENRVSGITYPNASTNTFSYNGTNLRTSKVDSGGTKNYITDGYTPASPVLSDGAAVYTPGVSERQGTTSKYYHGDALGSTRAITNGSQTVTDTQVFDAFGQTVSRTGSTPTPFGFVGSGQYQTDNDSGLMLLGNRYYDSSVGRFISSDPAKSGTNWYAYCSNNPLGETDPTGLSALGGHFDQHGNWIVDPLPSPKPPLSFITSPVWIYNPLNPTYGHHPTLEEQIGYILDPSYQLPTNPATAPTPTLHGKPEKWPDISADMPGKPKKNKLPIIKFGDWWAQVSFDKPTGGSPAGKVGWTDGNISVTGQISGDGGALTIGGKF